MPGEPAGPSLLVSFAVWKPVVCDQQRAVGLQVPVSAPQSLSVMFAATTDPKHATHVDGPVLSWEVQLIRRLHREAGRKAVLRCQRSSLCDHVCRYIGTVNVEALGEHRDQDPTGTAPKVERGLTKLPDCGSEIVEFLGLGGCDELGPPPRHQAVMPSPGFDDHGSKVLQGRRPLQIQPCEWRTLDYVALRHQRPTRKAFERKRRDVGLGFLV